MLAIKTFQYLTLVRYTKNRVRLGATGNIGIESCLACVSYLALQSREKTDSLEDTKQYQDTTLLFTGGVPRRYFLLLLINMCSAFVHWTELSVEQRGLLCIFQSGIV